jgi:dTDP-4-dehydrorhamnose 3,5-epimerase
MTSRFEIADAPLAGLKVIQRMPIGDERGWLERMFCTTDLAEILGDRSVRQVNRTHTRAPGTVRGMHYQVPPAAETKIVACLRGSIFDVAIDVRQGSPTFLEWHAETLSEENRRSLVVPEGFAHGLQALEPDTEILYVTTAAYDPAAERALHALDPRVGVAWPLPVEHLSDRDQAHQFVDADFAGVTL